jgi:hypothetical protein
LFGERLPAEIATRRAAGAPLRLLFYAHGGLTDERRGLEMALARIAFFLRNDVYPVYFVWESGLGETLADLLSGLFDIRDAAARRFGADVVDTVVEVVARDGGRRVWAEMKRNAERAAQTKGGARLVAECTRALGKSHPGAVHLHAVGHSAGAVFQAHFLSALLDAGDAPSPGVRSLHLLAPACSSTLFQSHLAHRVGGGRGIDALTVYTMNRTLELADQAGPYRKSLLYLVSRAFEDAQPTPILGLEDTLRGDADLARFFGLDGALPVADVILSTTSPEAPLNARSRSTTHGGFDNDIDTMNTLIRRVLAVPDSTAIVDFFEEQTMAT